MSPKSIKWDAATDAKLFSLIIQLYNVKVGGENLKRLNVAMGLAPNSQSLTHRISFLKKQASLTSGGAADDELKSFTPRPARKTKTPAKKKRKYNFVNDNEEEEENNLVLKTEPEVELDYTPFYMGGSKSLKCKASGSGEEEPNKFARSLMGKEIPVAAKPISSANEASSVQVDYTEEESAFDLNDGPCFWQSEDAI